MPNCTCDTMLGADPGCPAHPPGQRTVQVGYSSPAASAHASVTIREADAGALQAMLREQDVRVRHMAAKAGVPQEHWDAAMRDFARHLVPHTGRAPKPVSSGRMKAWWAGYAAALRDTRVSPERTPTHQLATTARKNPFDALYSLTNSLACTDRVFAPEDFKLTLRRTLEGWVANATWIEKASPDYPGVPKGSALEKSLDEAAAEARAGREAKVHLPAGLWGKARDYLSDRLSPPECQRVTFESL